MAVVFVVKYYAPLLGTRGTAFHCTYTARCKIRRACFPGVFAFSSVVGYQQQTLTGNNGITWAISTFQQIGKALTNQTLDTFAIPTDEGFGSGDSIVLEIYNESGSLDGAYSFVDEANTANYGLTYTGWYPLEKMQNWEATDDDLSNDVVVPFGKGVIITSGEANTTITFSGQVIDEAKSFDIAGNNGITWTGNATPVDLTLADFAIPVDEAFGSGDSIVLEIYNESGSLDGAYSFVDEANTANYGLTNTGWYPLEKMQNWEATDEDLSNSVSIPSGKMVIITSGEADTTLTLPNPMN